MSTEKLSELSKPVAWPNGCNETSVKALRYLAEHKRPIGGSDMYNTEHLYMIAREVEIMSRRPLYSQEYVSALLAELEAKDQAHRVHAARLISERGVLRERVTELEAKLATPIKIVNYDEFFICHVSGASDDYCKGWVDGRNAAARDVGKAGFTVEDK